MLFRSYMFQKQDLTVGIGIAGPSQVLSGGTVRYKFNMWDDLGSPNGASHLAVGSTAANANYSGYTYGTNRSVTWSTNNANIATIDANGVLTTKANGDVTITCRFKWTDNGVNYELVGTKRVHVMKPDVIGTTIGMSVWQHSAPVTGQLHIISKQAPTATNVAESRPFIASAGMNKRPGSQSYEVQTPPDGSAPYVRANVNNGAIWTLSGSDGSYKWQNVAANGYLGWHYKLIENDELQIRDKVRTDGGYIDWYSFTDVNTGTGQKWTQTLDYEGLSGAWKRLAYDNGKWKRINDAADNAKLWMTIYTPATINVSLDVTPATKTGLIGGTQQLTANPSQNYRYNGGGNYMWVSSNPDVATVDESGKVTYVSEGTATITCYYYWTDEIGRASCRERV